MIQIGYQFFQSINKSAYNIRFRNSRPEVFNKKGVRGNHAKFTGKHLCKRTLL